MIDVDLNVFSDDMYMYFRTIAGSYDKRESNGSVIEAAAENIRHKLPASSHLT